MTKRALPILVIIAFVILSSSIVFAQAQKVQIPNSSYYVYLATPGTRTPRSSFNPGETFEIHIENHGDDQDITYSLMIYDKDFVPMQADYVTGSIHIPSGGDAPIPFQYTIPPKAPSGTWRIEITIQDATGTYSGVIFFDVGVQPSPTPTTTTQPTTQPVPPPTPLPTELIIIGIAAVSAVAIVAVVLYYRGKTSKPPEAVPLPAPSSPIPSQTPVPPAPTAGEETVVTPTPVAPAMGAPAVGGETVVALARLVTPRGESIPITSMRQVFGREDFQRFVSPEQAKLISRRATPQFMIYFDTSTRQFYIVDNNSSNGTYLNGVNIKGRGPQPLNDGDKISPAGVIELVFQAS